MKKKHFFAKGPKKGAEFVRVKNEKKTFLKGSKKEKIQFFVRVILGAKIVKMAPQAKKIGSL